MLIGQHDGTLLGLSVVVGAYNPGQDPGGATTAARLVSQYSGECRWLAERNLARTGDSVNEVEKCDSWSMS